MRQKITNAPLTLPHAPKGDAAPILVTTAIEHFSRRIGQGRNYLNPHDGTEKTFFLQPSKNVDILSYFQVQKPSILLPYKNMLVA